MDLTLMRERDSLQAAVIFIIAAYLSLFNLGNAPLWHDEASPAWGAKNILLDGVGIYDGWNGRNLYTTEGGVTEGGVLRTRDFKIIGFPPWQVLPSALGVYLFGANEIGVRFFHTLLGVGALIIFWLLLRLEFPRWPRLRVLAFAMFALFPQTILFFRYGRYTADAIFFALLLFYFYRLYIGANGRLWHLIIAALAMILGFLNHYAIGSAFALTLAAWHLIYQARQTSRRQWIELIAGALLSGCVCLFYLLSADIIGSGEKLNYIHQTYKYSWLERRTIFLFYNFRELIQFGWLPMWVTLWFILFAARTFTKSQKTPKKKSRKIKDKVKTDSDAAAPLIIRWGMIIILFLTFSALLTLRKAEGHELADSRYLAAILPFTAFMIAAFIDSVWQFIDRHWPSPPRKGVFCALLLLAAALLSNAISYPYIYRNFFTKEKLRWTGAALIPEIHRPYGGFQKEILDFLNKHAQQDDTIEVSTWNDRGVFQFYLSDKLIFCCQLNKKSSALPKDKIRALKVPLYKGDIKPIWLVQILAGKAPDAKDYELVYTSESLGYPTQRPEMEFRTHASMPAKEGFLARIYRRRN